jgi:hypothetical protein
MYKIHAGKKSYRIKLQAGLLEDVHNVAAISHLNDHWVAFKDEAGVTLFAISSYDIVWYKLLTPEVDSK